MIGKDFFLSRTEKAVTRKEKTHELDIIKMYFYYQGHH